MEYNSKIVAILQKITYMQLFKGHYGVKAIQQEQQE